MNKKLSGNDYQTTSFIPNSRFTQTIGTGITAVGRVVSYDQKTGVLKYWQDKSLVGFNTNGSSNPSPTYGIELHPNSLSTAMVFPLTATAPSNTSGLSTCAGVEGNAPEYASR